MTEPKIKLDGPRIMPASGGAAKQLVMSLHGYGADGNDLISLGKHWRADPARRRFHLAATRPSRCPGDRSADGNGSG